MELRISSRVRLNNGTEMPVLGLGTWKLKDGKEAQNAVSWAIEAGYRHIDTAAVYGNEESVGRAVKESGIPREEVFITTKLWNSDHGNPERALNSSLRKLGTEYVDLYLIHWPVENRRLAAWKSMEKLSEKGLCRSIGVSNFTIAHLEELLENAGIVPAVNQVEFNPYIYQREILGYCTSKGIQAESYSPLAHGKRLSHSGLLPLAAAYSRSPAQIMIRWALQHGLVAIPKSSKKERIGENADVFSFSISQRDMEALDRLNEGFRTCWDPTNIP